MKELANMLMVLESNIKAIGVILKKKDAAIYLINVYRLSKAD